MNEPNHGTPAFSDSSQFHSGSHAGQGEAHGSLKGYLTGFILAAILTAIPFWLVMGHVIPDTTILIPIILIFGLAQIYVHLVYFLNLDSKTEGGWNLISLVFTMILVFVVIAGSIWVMFNLMSRMGMGMP